MSSKELMKQSMKPMEFVRFLYWSLMESNGDIKKPEDFDSDFYYLLTKSNISDREDRVSFCIQLISWLMRSDYINDTTKELIKFNGGCGMRTFFENRNRKLARYNMYKNDNEIDIPIENVNTLVSRVTADTNRLLLIFDNEIYNSIFIEEEPSYWKVYRRNFLNKASQSSYMSIDLKEFGFEIPYDRILTTTPSDSEFLEMLNVISLYSSSNRSKVLKEINNSCWGYLLYLCSCEPQKKKDKDNYKLVQEVINGTYNSIDKSLIENGEVVSREKELNDLEKELTIKEKELDIKERELNDKTNDLNRKLLELEERNNNSSADSAVLRKVVVKMEEIANGPYDKCQENLVKFVQLLKGKGL